LEQILTKDEILKCPQSSLLVITTMVFKRQPAATWQIRHKFKLAESAMMAGLIQAPQEYSPL